MTAPQIKAPAISEDIRYSAEGVLEVFRLMPTGSDEIDLIELIARALMSRDERAAKIAEAYPYRSPFHANTPSLDKKMRDGQAVASVEIATAIRGEA